MKALSWLLATLLLATTAAQSEVASAPHYTEQTPSRDGIGRVYMGREISQVMGHQGAGWLERPSRVQQERTDLLVQALALKADDVVLDLGAGTGYFSFPMALRVPEGKVLAVDIQPEMLDIIRLRKLDTGIDNVEPLLATECDPRLGDREVDVALLVDAYHEFSCPREVMAAVVAALAPDGRILLVEYRGEDPNIGIKPLHTMTVAQAEKEMAALGLTLESVADMLPMQHLMTFRRATPAP